MNYEKIESTVKYNAVIVEGVHYYFGCIWIGPGLPLEAGGDEVADIIWLNVVCGTCS
jgi:hypothetical protein